MPVELRNDEGVAFVRIDHGPVNALGLALRQGLMEAFEQIARDDAIEAVILHGAGRGFCAGGDLKAFGTPDASAGPGVSRDIQPAIERCGKPVVCAIHGYALGGGLETALACHYRVAESSARVGLPEGRHGIIPLSGSQRLPRLLGLERALALIVTGEVLPAEALPELFDRVAPEGQALAVATDLARKVAQRGGPHPLVRDLPAPRASDALRGLIDSVLASADAPDFDAGIDRAREIYDRLMEARR